MTGHAAFVDDDLQGEKRDGVGGMGAVVEAMAGRRHGHGWRRIFAAVVVFVDTTERRGRTQSKIRLRQFVPRVEMNKLTKPISVGWTSGGGVVAARVPSMHAIVCGGVEIGRLLAEMEMAVCLAVR